MSAIHDIYIKIIENQVWDASICILQYIYHITIHFSASLVAFKVQKEIFTTFFLFLDTYFLAIKVNGAYMQRHVMGHLLFLHVDL